ncbi:MAG: hypothetical protein M1835_000545 [Candelina submexicana]|nr:MAG: hypothetical protein M1835_000545 [Candelina submexicana]
MHTRAGEPASCGLTEANLRRQDEDQQNQMARNMAHAERVVREEQIHSYYSQMYNSSRLQQEGRATEESEEYVDHEHAHERIHNSHVDLKLFAQRQSGEVPIERFANLDAANDPTGFMERIEMNRMCIQPGQMDHMEQRRSNAKRIARDIKRQGESQEAQQPRELSEPRRRRHIRHSRRF